MDPLKRKNAWNNGGTFTNTDLLWYAKAVGVMQSRKLDDPTSWWFFAAMHGQTLTRAAKPGTFNWAGIPGPPVVPQSPLPGGDLIGQYWDQCQHGSWFFLPWHRGYLYAIENVLREIIQSLGGPSDWALPYWNYFGPAQQYKIPTAFTQLSLPDGSPNPLYVKARYGPAAISNMVTQSGINQKCQSLSDYKGPNPAFYGGDKTGFNHSSGPAGTIEYNPHGGVHVFTGWQNSDGMGGLMAKPDTAALDPVFYLHHCNIDRMWAAWNKTGKKNPTEQSWLKGPTATGDRKFYMPKPDKTPWLYTPEMMIDTLQLNYTYEELPSDHAPVQPARNEIRLRNFGFTNEGLKNVKEMSSDKDIELVGASSGSVSVDATGVQTEVVLDSAGWSQVAKSLNNTFESATKENTDVIKLPDEVYLQFEGVKGNEDSIVCTVSVNQKYVGHLYLFGLGDASTEDGPHGGAGLTVRFDISQVADELQLTNNMNLNSLNVQIQPINIVAKGNELTIDRISVYRKEQNG